MNFRPNRGVHTPRSPISPSPDEIRKIHNIFKILLAFHPLPFYSLTLSTLCNRRYGAPHGFITIFYGGFTLAFRECSDFSSFFMGGFHDPYVSKVGVYPDRAPGG